MKFKPFKFLFKRPRRGLLLNLRRDYNAGAYVFTSTSNKKLSDVTIAAKHIRQRKTLKVMRVIDQAAFNRKIAMSKKLAFSTIENAPINVKGIKS